jgi:hypothetical protein
MSLASVDDMLRLRWYALEWSCAHLRGDVDYLDRIWTAALDEFGQDDFAAEVEMVGREYIGRPALALWSELAMLDAAGRGGF